MSTVQLSALNAEILRNLGVVATNEGALQRVAKYVRRVARELTTDPTAMTKEEFFHRVEEAKNGPLYELQPGETLDDLISRVV